MKTSHKAEALRTLDRTEEHVLEESVGVRFDVAISGEIIDPKTWEALYPPAIDED